VFGVTFGFQLASEGAHHDDAVEAEREGDEVGGELRDEHTEHEGEHHEEQLHESEGPLHVHPQPHQRGRVRAGAVDEEARGDELDDVHHGAEPEDAVVCGHSRVAVLDGATEGADQVEDPDDEGASLKGAAAAAGVDNELLRHLGCR